jgi:hypothetical protein
VWQLWQATSQSQPQVRLVEVRLVPIPLSALKGGRSSVPDGFNLVLRGADVVEEGWFTDLPERKADFLENYPNPARSLDGLNLRLKRVKIRIDLTRRVPEALRLDELIERMELFGIGRPSTYAETITKLREKRLIAWNATTRQVRLTEAGLKVALTLRECAPETGIAEFTASLNRQIDEVAAGRRTAAEVILGVYERIFGRDEADVLRPVIWTDPENIYAVVQRQSNSPDSGGIVTSPNVPAIANIDQDHDRKID